MKGGVARPAEIAVFVVPFLGIPDGSNVIQIASAPDGWQNLIVKRAPF